jgi:hypothetical protein
VQQLALDVCDKLQTSGKPHYMRSASPLQQVASLKKMQGAETMLTQETCHK